jgi:hypothetical protein
MLTYNLTKFNNSFIIFSTKVGLVAVEGIDVQSKLSRWRIGTRESELGRIGY